jgi:nucleoside-diphosphate-sugar epimerase
MRVFLAGATGVIGIRLLPLLVARGHEVAAMTRDAGNQTRLEQLGASPVVCDVYDLPALNVAMAASRPEMVIHQLTDLPDDLDQLPAAMAANSRMRQEGTSNLLGAARAAGATRCVAQSIAWEPSGDGAVAKHEHERMVLDFGGLVIRYGQFYGPDTYQVSPPSQPRIQIDSAARRTLDALDQPKGIITLTDECDWD